jgi:hypothetical protein
VRSRLRSVLLVLSTGSLAACTALLAAHGWEFGRRGVVQIVPQTAIRYLPASAAAPLAVFVVGVLLVGIALWLARSSRVRHQ